MEMASLQIAELVYKFCKLADEEIKKKAMSEKTKVNEKYLDHIQSVITRHNSNSFMIKGWTITICTAILAIAGTWKEPLLSLIALVPIIVFWVLDSFYLANERCFVSLYNAAINGYKLIVKNEKLLRKKQVKTELDKGRFVIDQNREVEIESFEYSMNFIPFRIIKRNNWFNVVKSKTILWFYLMLAGFSIALFIGLLFINCPKTVETLKVSVKLEQDTIANKTLKSQIILDDSLRPYSIKNLK